MELNFQTMQLVTKSDYRRSRAILRCTVWWSMFCRKIKRDDSDNSKRR